MSRIELTLLEAATEAVANTAPHLAAAALRETAAQVDEPLASLSLDLLAGYVAEHGAEGVEAAADALADAITGDNPSAVFAAGFSAAHLTRLTDHLQSAEASKQRQTARWVRAAGAMLVKLGTLLAKAALEAL